MSQCPVRISSRSPRPRDEPLVAKMRDKRIRSHPTSRGIEQRLAQLAGRQAIPRHPQRRKPPSRRARNAARILIIGLMTGPASQGGGAAVIQTTLYVEQMSVLIVALARMVDRRMAI